MKLSSRIHLIENLVDQQHNYIFEQEKIQKVFIPHLFETPEKINESFTGFESESDYELERGQNSAPIVLSSTPIKNS